MKPTEYSTRHANVTKTLDPYVSVDVDDAQVYRTASKGKTFRPVWNEAMSSEIHEAQTLTFTVFHDASIPPDDFVANCTIPFEELLNGLNKDGKNDAWVSLSLLQYLALALALSLSRPVATVRSIRGKLPAAL